MSLTVSRILHAGHVFESGGTRVLFDPLFETPFSRNCHAWPAVRFDLEAIARERFDAVFVSHWHDDHCSMESLVHVHRDTPVYLYCEFTELFEYIRTLGFSQVMSLVLDRPVRVGEITVTPRRALDAMVDCMFQVRAGGINVLNVVDAWIDDADLPALAALGPWDMVIWPFQTMRERAVIAPRFAEPADEHVPQEWLEQLQALAPRVLVPGACQFMFDEGWLASAFFPVSVAGFMAQAAAVLPQTMLLRMNPSVSVVVDHNGIGEAPALPWVIPVGDQSVDYHHDPAVLPTPMAVVARGFAALSAQQTEYVRHFCTHELALRYAALEPADEPYFDVPRRWRLSVFDHEGTATHYHFVVDDRTVTRVSNAEIEDEAEWLTEVSIARLFGALTEGETLTSLWVRINDTEMPPARHEALAGADVLQDPLLRTLYEVEFGAYQRAQLRRLGVLS